MISVDRVDQRIARISREKRKTLFVALRFPQIRLCIEDAVVKKLLGRLWEFVCNKHAAEETEPAYSKLSGSLQLVVSAARSLRREQPFLKVPEPVGANFAGLADVAAGRDGADSERDESRSAYAR